MARQGQHLWGMHGHTGINPACCLPLFLETPHFSEASGIQALGLAFLWRTTTALRRGLVSLWPINIKTERVSVKHSSPNQRSFILHLLLHVVSESLILRRGCGYALFVFFLFPSLSFFLSCLLRITFRETCVNAFQWHASCHFSIRAGGGNPEFIYKTQF